MKLCMNRPLRTRTVGGVGANAIKLAQVIDMPGEAVEIRSL